MEASVFNLFESSCSTITTTLDRIHLLGSLEPPMEKASSFEGAVGKQQENCMAYVVDTTFD